MKKILLIISIIMLGVFQPVIASELAPEGYDINLYLYRETPRSFFFRWDPPSDALRQAITLEVDGEIEYQIDPFMPDRRYARVLKRAHRKDSQLTFRVQSWDIIDLTIIEEVEFTF